MQSGQSRRSFQTLEGLRAVGAFMIVVRHVTFLFGPLKFPESFLAVDLFYLVSGFVVAHAYGQRLEKGGFVKEFVKTRLIRLYPLYLVGMALGLAAAVTAAVTDPTGWWNPGRVAEGLATGLLMIPLFPGLSANGSSLDGPTWTLLPELIANFVYAAAYRFMKTWTLVVIMLVCAAGLVFAEFHYETLDVGYNATDQWAALARVGFSFFAGVLIFKLLDDRLIISRWASWAALVALGAALGWQPSDDFQPYYELGVVLVGFPLLLLVAAHFEPGERTGRVFRFLGLSSYAIYIVHQPLGTLTRQAFKDRIIVPGDLRGLAYGAVFMAGLVVLAWLLDERVDAPVRKVLRARFMPSAAPSRA